MKESGKTTAKKINLNGAYKDSGHAEVKTK